MKNGFWPARLRRTIGGTWRLSAIFLLATALAAQAETSGDYYYEITPNNCVRIDGYTGPGGAVVIPSTIDGRAVIGLGSSAFAGCTNLTGVTVPNSVLYLEDRVFNGCTSLAGVTLGRGVASIGFDVFGSCSSLTAITVDAGNAVYSSSDGVLFNKDQTTLIEHPEGKAGSYAIPAGVTNIQDYAFECCYGLTGITLPAGVVSIGKQAFWFCTNLPAVTIPDSVTSIGDNAFNWCAGLTNVTLGGGVARIGDFAFYECTGLAGVTIPASVTNIGEFAFSRCTALAAITVEAGNAAYSSLSGVLFNKDQTVLVQCPGGKTGSYSIPGTVTNIGGDPFAPWPGQGLGGFSWCIHLTSVAVPDGVTSLGKNAFLYCTNLADIALPASVVSIGYEAFENCTRLASFAIPVNVSRIAYWAFAGCTGLRSVTIPSGVTNIEDQAFTGCSGLAGVEIPNSVAAIGMGAFSSCTSLTSVTVGRGVVGIEDSAFAGCVSLAGAYFRGDAPSVGDSVFANADRATVYYLAGTLGWGATFGGRPTALWNALPEPRIKANGVAGELNVNYPAPVTITVELDAGSYAGVEVDWWVIAYAHSGQWYYLDSFMQWTPFSGDLTSCRPVCQGPLANLSATKALDRYQLPRGAYDFWFAVDYPPDGILDLSGQVLFEKVSVLVQ